MLHLERGEPDFDTPPHVVEALARAARDGHTHYPDLRGAGLREAIAAKLARENGIASHPDDVTWYAGGTHGLFLVLQALLSPGDELLALSPYWMAIPNLVGFAPGASLRGWPACPRCRRRVEPRAVRRRAACGDRPAHARAVRQHADTTRPAP